MNKNLATIQRVLDVQPHNNADSFELIKILGWQVIVKKGEFKIGDLVIYITTDSIVPEHPEFEFLRNKKFKINPFQFKGAESAGVCCPLSILEKIHGGKINEINGQLIYVYLNLYFNMKELILTEGTDVTSFLNISKYETPIPAELAGQSKGIFPNFLIVTEEDNLRTYPSALEELWGLPYYITRKDSGCSGTFYINGGDFGVCSRHVDLKESNTNGFWRMAKKYDIKNALQTEFKNESWAIQGVICGPGIQKNPLGLTEMELHVFNLFDIKSRTYANFKRLSEFCKKYNLIMVTVITEGTAFGYDIDGIVKLASEQKYPNGCPAEGIVIRPFESFTSTVLKKAWSGKVINPLFKNQRKKQKINNVI